MKELLLHTSWIGVPLNIGQHEVTRWLTVLAGVPEGGDAALPARLLCRGLEEWEIWMADAAPAEGVRAYQRVRFRIMKEETEWRIAFSLPEDVGVYTAVTLLELGMPEELIRQVVMDGQVLLFEKLTEEQRWLMEKGFAVLTPQLAKVLGVKCPVTKRMTHAELSCEAERRLAWCFPRGGRVEGCPLEVDLHLPDVPEDRIFMIPEELRQWRFGRLGSGSSLREGLSRYGTLEAAPYRQLTVVMLYPEGRIEDARRLFRLMKGMQRVMATMLLDSEEKWVAYRADETAGDYLAWVLYSLQAEVGLGAGSYLYCYIPPVGEALRGLLIRLRRLVRSFGSLFWGPVPLCAIDEERMNWQLPSVAAELLVQMGRRPWAPLKIDGLDSTLLVGLSCLERGGGQDGICAAAFFVPSSLHCLDEVVGGACHFSFLFRGHYRMAYEHFVEEYSDCLPDRLVVYCHRDVQDELLAALAKAVGSYSPALPMVVARVRHPVNDFLYCYEADGVGNRSARGTCLYGLDGWLSICCRGMLPALGRRKEYCSAPLEVKFDRLAADGNLFPLSRAEEEALAAQTYRLVWSRPACVDGTALPSVLSYADGLVRRSCCGAM